MAMDLGAVVNQRVTVPSPKPCVGRVEILALSLFSAMNPEGADARNNSLSDFPWPWGMMDDKPLCTLAAEQTGATAGGLGDSQPLLWALAVPLQHGENESRVTPNHPGMCFLQRQKVEEGCLPQNLAMAMLRGRNSVGADCGIPTEA